MAIVRVDGLAELRRSFRAYDKALAQDLDDALEEAANPVRRDAQSLAQSSIRRIGPSWGRMRVGSSRNTVWVAPVERGVTRGGNARLRRRNLADLIRDRALEPALTRNEGPVIRRVNQALDEFGRVWERTI